MPDLDRLLDEFDPRDGDLAPSPAEIRHRGDRLRRRNRALAVVGSAVAVAVIATPLALLNRGDEQTAPPPAEEPESGLLTQVPDGFPLAWEMPATSADGTPVVVTEIPGVAELAFCGETAWTPQAPVPTTDVAGATFTGPDPDPSGAGDPGPDADVNARTLAVYAEKAQARAALDSIRSGLEGCTDDPSGDRFRPDLVRGSTVSYTRIDTDESGEALEEGVTVERYGNALLFDLVRRGSIRSALSDGRLPSALEVFEGRPVPRLEGVKLASSTLYPSDMPAARALPADGLTGALGPWKAVDVDDGPFVACRPDGTLDQLGTSLRYTSQFRAGSEPSADLLVSLVEFGDGATAREARDVVQGWADGCGYEQTSADGDGRYLGTQPVEADGNTTRLHALGLAQEGNRLVVVAYSAIDTGSTRDDLVAETSQVLDRGLGR